MMSHFRGCPAYGRGPAAPPECQCYMIANDSRPRTTRSARVGVLIFATEKYLPMAHSLRDSLVSDRIMIGPGAYDLPLPWPLGTLLRPFWYRITLRESQSNYIFAMDADLRVVAPLDWSKMVGRTVAVLHPGFTGRHAKPGTFERNPASAAYVPPTHTEPYFAGGLWGGEREAFLDVCNRACKIIETDLRAGRIPIWHDESVMNRIWYETPPEKILGPEYLTPEGTDWYGPTDGARILAVAKDHEALRRP